MLDEYQKELVNEILIEISKMRDFYSANDSKSYCDSEERIQVIAKILKGDK